MDQSMKSICPVKKYNPELTCLLVIMHMHKKELLKIDDVQDKDS